jgi:F0F1-type ATP synthase gamma subunit
LTPTAQGLGESNALQLTAAPPFPSATSRDRSTGALIFGSDQGLVGRFNEVIGEFALAALREHPMPQTLWGVGERCFGGIAALTQSAATQLDKRGAV